MSLPATRLSDHPLSAHDLRRIDSTPTDKTDAKRLVDAAITLATLPQIMSSNARALAASYLRGITERNPGVPPVLSAIVRHLEQPGAE